MSKVAAEIVVSTWQNIWKLNGGPKVISVRAGNVIGGGDSAEGRLLPDLIEGFTKNTQITIKNPKSTRPWQHVIDPLIGYIMAMENLNKSNELENFNFGPIESSLTVEEIAYLAKDLWESKSEINISQANNQLESVNLSLDSDKAKKLLNWEPIWNQKQAVELTVAWWKKVLRGSINPLDCTIENIEFAQSYLQNKLK
jgi:CDP-glucose 4,6-dehydratase